MKVLFCVGFPIDLNDEISGTGNWISSLIKNLILSDDLKFEIAICYIDPKVKNLKSFNSGNVKLYQIPSLKGNKVKVLLSNYGLIDPYLDLHNYVKGIASDFKPQIIQIFGYESQFVRLFGKLNIPIVIHFQGFKRALNYKYFQRISQRELNKVTTFKEWFLGSTSFFLKRKSLITSYISRFDTTQVKYVLGRTEWDRLVTHAVSPNAQYFYCQELLRKSFYESLWKYPANEKFQIFTITGSGSTKNVDIMFEVAQLLDIYHPNLEYTWRVAGIDESNRLVKIMRKRGFNNESIQLLGKLKSEDLINEILRCNLYVYPSGMDNSPNALMEAMLVGAPVLSNYSGGISSIVEHGKTGYLVNEGEPYAMVGAIADLANKKDFLIELGKTGREESQQRNSPKSVIEQLTFAYKNILNFENSDTNR